MYFLHVDHFGPGPDQKPPYPTLQMSNLDYTVPERLKTL